MAWLMALRVGRIVCSSPAQKLHSVSSFPIACSELFTSLSCPHNQRSRQITEHFSIHQSRMFSSSSSLQARPKSDSRASKKIPQAPPGPKLHMIQDDVDKLSIAIVGRPNVGKSTLFNRLAQRGLALVDPTPGVTRDVQHASVSIGDMRFVAMDTAGIEPETPTGSLLDRMKHQTTWALQRADVALMVIDIKTGIQPADLHVARLIRDSGVPCVLIANKCDVGDELEDVSRSDLNALGLGSAIPMCAEQGFGLADLYMALQPIVAQQEFEYRWHQAERARLESMEAEQGKPFSLDGSQQEDPIKLAIIGRPNVGKSTMVNALFGQRLLLAGPEPGLTRDSIALDAEFAGRKLRLIDTAGLKRKLLLKENIEKQSHMDTLRSIRYCHVAVVLVDAAEPLSKDDLSIVRRVVEEGRAIVLAVNKWDMVTDQTATLAALREKLEANLPQIKGVPTVLTSGLDSRNLGLLLNASLQAYDRWNVRLPTGRLNRFVQRVNTQFPSRRPPAQYVTQIKARPPTFAIFGKNEIPPSYTRMLTNALREEFGLQGVPMRFLERTTK